MTTRVEHRFWICQLWGMRLDRKEISLTSWHSCDCISLFSQSPNRLFLCANKNSEEYMISMKNFFICISTWIFRSKHWMEKTIINLVEINDRMGRQRWLRSLTHTHTQSHRLINDHDISINSELTSSIYTKWFLPLWLPRSKTLPTKQSIDIMNNFSV